MKNSVKILNRKSFSLLFLGFCLACGTALNTNAQERDPFRKPVVAAPKPKVSNGTGTVKVKQKPGAPTVVVAPPIQARIDGYKANRQRCAELGVACPKPTSVLTLDEMQVTGIFRTPRGYAAMVEATPIKLSYTVYPGEKFYDGQLVAIEETKLIFRKVTRLTDGKEFVTSADKTLRQETINDMSATRAEAQPQQTNLTVAVGTAAPTQGLPTEAVPMQENKPAAAPAINAKGMQQNGSQTNLHPASTTAVPAKTVSNPNGAVPTPAKAKAKGNSPKPKSKN